MVEQERPMVWPALEHYSDTPIFNTKAVVQKTGVPAPTLRAWERRYQLLTPQRANNAYRLYSERDIALICWLKECIDAGMSISHAIALFRHLNEEQKQAEPAPGMPLLLDGQATLARTLTKPAPLRKPAARALQLKETERPVEPLSSLQEWQNARAASLQTSYPAIYDMQLVKLRLIEAFEAYNEPAAAMLMASMLAVYPLEQICTELITPTMWQIGEMWEQGQASASVEHFASSFFRGHLNSLFQVMSGAAEGPLTIVGCAPGESHELGALMLALCLRRSNLRVIYLGQSLETAGLLQAIHRLSPALVCVSLTMPTYLPELLHLGRQIQRLAHSRPIFVFGGQVFQQYASIIPQIPGIYLDGGLKEIVSRLRYMLYDHSVHKN
ncbi:MerR family transcriptional regulator [Ktedonosporobacter rubrisoli]|uniref:MerR family transcriptional regulator n=1 Tax=Ktedonosporobacter rubrisoli TaxID=2509675 RepID=A0A4P6JZ53_KTERU|nr:MerR family transcriptional regulator [Ktedonosporobacter rubrisoli]QBD81029.1 MerR family transcriptional regulator [Ktedonosporobacter rubrisoli]